MVCGLYLKIQLKLTMRDRCVESSRGYQSSAKAESGMQRLSEVTASSSLLFGRTSHIHLDLPAAGTLLLHFYEGSVDLSDCDLF